MLTRPTTCQHFTLWNFRINPEEHTRQARIRGSEIILHLNPDDLERGDNPRSPYAYRGMTHSIVCLADRIIIHLAGGGQFVAKDKFKAGYNDAAPPVVSTEPHVDPALAYLVITAAAPLAAVMISCICGLRNGGTFVLVLASLVLAAAVCLIHSLGDEIGCLPDDAGTDRPHGA